MARIRTLDVIEVEEPCTEDWDAMLGQGAARFCQLCRFDVFDLSQMTEDEARRTVERSEGRICVRFYRRADGTVVTADCGPARFEALRRGARRTLQLAGGFVAALLAFVLGLAGVLALRLGGDEARDAVASKLEVVAKPMLPAWVTIAPPEPEPPPEARPTHRPRMGRMRLPPPDAR